jgi:carboxynorspermidine decarboxylase
MSSTDLATPYYLIDKPRLRTNLERIAWLREASGAKSLLALKCFATWSVFDFMAGYMDGTTSSSLHEVKLGRAKFPGETHAYAVAWADHEIDEAVASCDKIIFNSVGQLKRFDAASRSVRRGLRVNPGVSSSSYDLADPARPFSRLGEHDPLALARAMDEIGDVSGFMFHNNCENGRFERFDELLAVIEARFGHLLQRVDWVSLGGGLAFTNEGYPLQRLADRLKRFADTFGVQVYLEPGEAAVAGSTTLEVTVLDTLHNGRDLAVVDSSIEAHMLDLLIYRYSARLRGLKGPIESTSATSATSKNSPHRWMVCGRSCLAGDVFGTFDLPAPLQVGDRLSIEDAAAYTMVKKNWFNGVAMPSIAVRELDGSVHRVRSFGHDEFVAALS